MNEDDRNQKDTYFRSRSINFFSEYSQIRLLKESISVNDILRQLLSNDEEKQTTNDIILSQE